MSPASPSSPERQTDAPAPPSRGASGHFSPRYPNGQFPIIRTVGELRAALAHFPDHVDLFSCPIPGESFTLTCVVDFGTDGPGTFPFVLLEPEPDTGRIIPHTDEPSQTPLEFI